jgi:predicted deacetylase
VSQYFSYRKSNHIKSGIEIKKKFILELHDLTPNFTQEIEMMLDWVDYFGVTEPLFMWIPTWAGIDSLKENIEFGKKIGSLPGTIVLHGLSHTSPGGIWDRIWYASSTGAEFKKLDQKRARSWLLKGRSLLEKWSSRPVRWFCAPRWQQSSGTKKSLYELGFFGFFKKESIEIFGGGNIKLTSVSFDHGGRKIIKTVNRHLRKKKWEYLIASGCSFRLVLHPQDMKDKKIEKELYQIRDRIKLENWKAISLNDLFTR